MYTGKVKIRISKAAAVSLSLDKKTREKSNKKDRRTEDGEEIEIKKPNWSTIKQKNK